MANYNTLKSAIQDVIKQNGNNEITGSLLQSALLSMVDSLGVGYQFAGVAIPSTNPGTPDQNVFYLALQPGTYNNFGGTVVAAGEIGVFTYNGAWTYTVKTIIDGGFLLCGNAVPGTVPETPLGRVCYIAIEPGVYTNFDGIKVFPGTLAILYCSDGVWSKKEIRPIYVSNPRMQNCIQELYIETQADVASLRLSIMTWTGTTLSINIKDTDGNIVSAVVTRPTKPYEAVPLSTYKASPIEVKGYIVMNENIDTISYTTGYSLYKSCANLLFKPFITNALIGEYKADIAATKVQIQKEESPICAARINRGALNPNGLYNNSYISISRRFTPTHDALLVFGNKDAAAVTNKFFDFFGFYVHEIDVDSGLIYYPQNATQFGTGIVVGTTTDSILPVVVGAVNNPDGDNTSKWFTGQNHAYGNVSTGPSRTMREISNDVWVDNVPVSIGQLGVRGKKCIIQVVNRVQAYNTVKQDGTGREVIEQKITVEMDNARCVVRVEYLALEDVIFYNIPGVGQYGAPNTGRQFRFLGSTSKMGLYDFSATAVSPSANDRAINCIQLLRNGYALDLVMRNFGLGNLAYNTSQNNAYFTSGAKVYTRLTDGNAEIAVPQGGKIGFEVEYNTLPNVK